jgi:hypothetical protein
VGKWRDICQVLLRENRTLLLNADRGAGPTIDRFIAACFAGKRAVNISSETNKSWAHYCGVIAGCESAVTTDTSTTHVAAAVETPCVTIFQFIDSQLRIVNFPRARGLSCSAFRKSELWGLSHPYPGWTPQGHDEDPKILRPWKGVDLSRLNTLLREVA